MSSGHKRDLTTTSTSKSGGATVTGETVMLPPDCEDVLLTVTTDDSVSGAVNAILEVSADGVNWTEAKTRTGGSAGVPAQIAHGTVTMPSLTASAATQVCTITYAGGALGDNPTYTLEILTDTDNTPGDHTYYHLRNVTTGGSPAQSISGVTFGDSVVLQTHGSPFSFPDGYEHNKVTVKVTESTNGLTSEVQIGDAETGIFRRAPATITIDNYQDPMAGNAATGAHICDIEPAGGPDAGSVVTYNLVITANSSNAGPDTDISYFKMKYGSTESTYNASASPKTVTLNNVPEGTTVQLQVVGDKDADGNAGSANWYFSEAKVFKLDIKCTESGFNQEVSATIDDINVDAVATYNNDKYWAFPSDGGSYTMPWASGTSAGVWANWNTHGAPTMEDDWAVQFWFKTDNSDSSYLQQDFYLWALLNNTWDPRIYIYLTSYETGAFGTQTRIYPKVNIQNAANSVNVIYQNTDSNMINHITWTHLVFNKKATPNTTVASAADMDIWLNGTQLTTTMTGSGTYAAASFTNLGNIYARCIHPFPKGQWGFDELAFWDRALTDAEIGNLYNSGNFASASEQAGSGLRGWYRFGDGDNGSGTADDHNTCHDMSGDANGKDLELTYGGSETDMIKDH